MNDRAQELKEDKLDFGDYCVIEQKRFGCANDMYLHKVIRRFRSNAWVDVPVCSPPKETIHDETEDVLACICCGVSETEVLKYRERDCKPHREGEKLDLGKFTHEAFARKTNPVSAALDGVLEEVKNAKGLTKDEVMVQELLLNYLIPIINRAKERVK